MENLYDTNIEGIGKVNGGRYKNINAEGVVTFQKDVQAEIVSIEGCGKIEGNLSCTEINLEGTLKCMGSIESENNVSLSGDIKIDGNLQCGSITCEGRIVVGGLLSADKIMLSIKGTNRISEIGGEDIEVRFIKNGIFDGVLTSNKLIVNQIEGDSILLENTRCRIVRGHNIEIRRGCIVERVEYTGELILDDNAKVKEVIKL